MEMFAYVKLFFFVMNLTTIHSKAFDNPKACLQDPNLPLVLIRSFAAKFIEIIFQTSTPEHIDVRNSYVADDDDEIVGNLFNTQAINQIVDSIVAKNEIKENLYKSPQIVSKLNQLSDISSSFNQINSILSDFKTSNEKKNSGNKERKDEEGASLLKTLKHDIHSKDVEHLKSEMLEGINKIKDIIIEQTDESYMNKQNSIFSNYYNINDENDFDGRDKDGSLAFPNISSTTKELRRIQECLRGYEDTQFEDGTEWFSCFYVCKDLRQVSSTLNLYMSKIDACGRTGWLRDVIIRLFMQVFRLDKCHFEILKPTRIVPLDLVEGIQEKKELVFQLYTFPGVYCFPAEVTSNIPQVTTQIFKYVFRFEEYCKVEVEISTGSFIQNFRLPFNLEINKTEDGGSEFNDNNVKDFENNDWFSGVKGVVSSGTTENLQNYNNTTNYELNFTSLKDILKKVKVIPLSPKCHTGKGIIRIATKTHPQGIINKDTQRIEDWEKEDNPMKVNLKVKLAKKVVGLNDINRKPKTQKQTMGHLKINDLNWNQTFILPLALVATHKHYNHKHDDVNITFKMVVDQKRINSTKLQVRIYNTPIPRSSVCQSINDPHLTTFDHVYYNNLYHGYFILYKHHQLPYEVQTIYQGCGKGSKGVSCACGVAVRSGDDVVVVDRCRRAVKNKINDENDNINGLKKIKKTKNVVARNSYRKRKEENNVLKVKLFKNGPLTTGFRIFKKDAGLTYQVLMPHGTLVTIQANGQSFLNTWILPSSYDISNTSGLCGLFNGINSDDLLHSDGTSTNVDNARKEYPTDFIKSWRVSAEDSIFQGVKPSSDPDNKEQHCRCLHGFLNKFECSCEYGALVETCDLDLGEEWIQPNISSIVVPGIHQESVTDDIKDEIDIDELYEPLFNLTGEKIASKVYCANLLLKKANSIIIKTCTLLSLFPLNISSTSYSFSSSFLSSPIISIPDIIKLLETLKKSPLSSAVKGCVDDIDITGRKLDLPWKLSAIDAAKKSCLFHITRKHSFVYRVMAGKFKNDSCVNQCYFRGFCVNGICRCKDGYKGPDCSLPDSSSPSLISPLNNAESSLSSLFSNVFCNVRNENCSYVKITGRNFVENSVSCIVNQIKKTDLDHVTKKDSFSVETELISPNQAVCMLPANTEVLYEQEYQKQQKLKYIQQTKNKKQQTTEEIKEDSLKVRDIRDVSVTNKLSHSIKVSFPAFFAANKRNSETKGNKNDEIDTKVRTVTESSFEFIVYDSVCQKCDHTSGECQMKMPEDYCVIEGNCVGGWEESVWDSCVICNISASKSIFTLKQTEDCIARNKIKTEKEKRDAIDVIIRVTVSAAISFIIIIVTIVIYVKDKKRNRTENAKKFEFIEFSESDKKETLSDVKTTANNKSNANQEDENDVIVTNFNGGFLCDQNTDKFNNETINTDSTNRISHVRNHSELRRRAESSVSSLFYREPEHFSFYHNNSDSTTQEKQQQQRARANSETSHGLGGGGPMLFGGYNRVGYVFPPGNNESSFDPISDQSYHGIGGHATSLFPTSLDIYNK